MSRNAKVFARVFGFSIPAGAPASTMDFVVEWKLLGGTREGGKETFTITALKTDDKLKVDLRDALAEFLSTKFAPQVFEARDIVGYSV